MLLPLCWTWCTYPTVSLNHKCQSSTWEYGTLCCYTVQHTLVLTLMNACLTTSAFMLMLPYDFTFFTLRMENEKKIKIHGGLLVISLSMTVHFSSSGRMVRGKKWRPMVTTGSAAPCRNHFAWKKEGSMWVINTYRNAQIPNVSHISWVTWRAKCRYRYPADDGGNKKQPPNKKLANECFTKQ